LLKNNLETIIPVSSQGVEQSINRWSKILYVDFGQ